jgi:hypothetical protein
LVLYLTEDAELLQALGIIIEDILSGRASPEVHRLMNGARELPLVKGEAGVRPISPPEALLQVASSYALLLIPQASKRELFGPLQQGVGIAGGAERTLHEVQTALEYGGPDVCCIAPDISNAFPNTRRAVVVTELLRLDAFKPIAPFLRWIFAKPANLFLQDDARKVTVLTCGEGLLQGCNFAPLAFCVALQPSLREVDREHPAVVTRAYLDDAAFVGSATEAAEAAQTYERAIDEKGGWKLNALKSRILWPHAGRPVPEALLNLAAAKGWKVEIGAMRHLGGVIGFGAAREAALAELANDAANKHEAFFAMLRHPAMPAQIAMTMLQASGVPRMSYLTRVCPPQPIMEGVRRFDALVKETLLAKLDIPGIAIDQVQAEQIQMPLRLGGFGIRRSEDRAPVAFWAAAATYVPSAIQAMRLPQAVPTAVPSVVDHMGPIHSQLVMKGVQPQPNFFPPADANFIEFYGPGAPPKLQAALGRIIDANHAAYLHRIASPAAKARLVSLRLPNAGLWTRITPSKPQQVLFNAQVSLAAKLRLGVNISPFLPDGCPACNDANAYDRDVTHALGCTRLSRTAHTKRHDDIVTAIHAFARQVGIPSRIEPRENGERRGPDIELTLEQGPVLVDVTVVHPAAPTYLNHAHGATNAYGPLDHREAAKHRKYAGLVQNAGASEFVACAISSFGGFGRGAQRMFMLLRYTVEAMGGVSWAVDPVGELARDIAIAVQRGSALSATEACQRAGVDMRAQGDQGRRVGRPRVARGDPVAPLVAGIV